MTIESICTYNSNSVASLPDTVGQKAHTQTEDINNVKVCVINKKILQCMYNAGILKPKLYSKLSFNITKNI